MSTVLRAMAAALVLTACLVAAGVLLTGGEDEKPAAEAPRYRGIPLSSYDTTGVTARRAGFCDRVAAEAVAEALGDEPTEEAAYDNGERAALAVGVDDVAHEYGCRFTAGDRGAARAWVFAPPVTTEGARELAGLARAEQGCQEIPDAEAYGDPSVALVCDGKARRTASYRGLFGDAWLACSLTTPAGTGDQELLDRTGRWCVAVAEAASSGS